MSDEQPLTYLLNGQTLTLLDIGARRGVWERFLPVAGHTDVVALEADVNECQRLQVEATLHPQPWRSVRYLPVAVGAGEENRPFYVLRSENLSSLLRPNIELLQTYEDPHLDRWEIRVVREVTTVPLDRLNERFDLPTDGTDFLKVDTQGSELEILESGRGLVLDALVGVETEVEFMPVYEGQPLFADVDSFLRRQGFELYHLDRFYAGGYRGYGKRQICWGNALYVKHPHAMAHRADRAEKLRKSLVVALLYGLVEPALRLLALNSEWLPREDRERIRARIDHDFASGRDRLRWRLSLLRDTVSLILAPSLRKRFAVAQKALRVDGPSSVAWRVLPPGL